VNDQKWRLVVNHIAGKMVISMLTPKRPVLVAIALSLLLPDAALAQARSSAGGSPAPSPRLSAPTATSPPVSPSPTAPTTAQPGSTVPPLSPMSPPLPSQFATGGGSSSGSSLALSPGTSSGSGSASEAAPSRPGGGGKSLADCMGFWDAATHMSKVEWRAACKRSMQEFPNVKW